jgi:mRNA-degrading endonuclease RelE of RelBE toxin-antitoxin system
LEEFSRSVDDLDGPDQERVGRVIVAIMADPYLHRPDRYEQRPGDPNSNIIDVSLGDFGVVYRIADREGSVLFVKLKETGASRGGTPKKRSRKSRLLERLMRMLGEWFGRPRSPEVAT